VRTATRLVWLVAALALVAFWMARSLAPSLDPLVIQDDARQHVFWMQRLLDPSLLQNDLYADYFAGQAPPGFVLLFRGLLLFADPLTASKLLPPALGLLAAAFTFLLVERLYPSRPAAFLATIIGSWYVWQYDDLPTGSPRAFLLPLTVMLLYGLVAGWRWWGLVLVVAAEALLYPSAAALGVVLVGTRLVRLGCCSPRISRDWRQWRTVLVCGVVAVALLVPTVLGESRFGPTVDARTAREMPEFGPNGRNAFFTPDPYVFWIQSYRSGFDLRVTDASLPAIPILWELLDLALTLPLALLLRRLRPGGLTLGPPLAPTVLLIGQVMLASLVLFLGAHLLLFRLYLPARFVAWTIPLALSIAAGVGITALVESALTPRLPLPRNGEGEQATRLPLPRARGMMSAEPIVAPRSGLEGRGLPLVVAALFAVGLVLYPARFDGNFVTDRTPRISAYLRSLPPETVVLAPPVESDSIPAFSGRRVLMNREYALAYHLGYYREVQQRVRDGIAMYYAEQPAQIVALADAYGVTAIIVDPAAFDPATAADAWAGSFEPYTSLVLERLQGRRRFALLDERRRCTATSEGDLTVILVACLRSRV
jgi:hypothetical protein